MIGDGIQSLKDSQAKNRLQDQITMIKEEGMSWEQIDSRLDEM